MAPTQRARCLAAQTAPENEAAVCRAITAQQQQAAASTTTHQRQAAALARAAFEGACFSRARRSVCCMAAGVQMQLRWTSARVMCVHDVSRVPNELSQRWAMDEVA